MKKKILLLEDEVDLLMVLQFRLERMGYDVHACTNGCEALEFARREKPDAVIADVYVPGMNGDEVVGAIKKDPDLKHIYAVLISAAIQILEAKARGCGADGFFYKPFDVKELTESVEKGLQSGV